MKACPNCGSHEEPCHDLCPVQRVHIGDTFVLLPEPAKVWEITAEPGDERVLVYRLDSGNEVRLSDAAHLTETGPGAKWARCGAIAVTERR